MARTCKKRESLRGCPDPGPVRDRLMLYDRIKRKGGASISVLRGLGDVDPDRVEASLNAWLRSGLLKVSGGGAGDALKFNDGGLEMVGVGFSDESCHIVSFNMEGKRTGGEDIPISPIHQARGRIKELNAIVKAIADSTGIKKGDPALAGVAVPGALKDKNERAWEILGQGVSRTFGCDTVIMDDFTAAAYGEREICTGTRGDDTLYIHSDIGAGVVIKGELLMASPEDDGPEAAYLRPWGQFSVVETAKTLVRKGLGTDIVNMVNGDIANITLEVVQNAAEENDELAEDLLKRAGLALGVRLAYLVNVFDTDRVILGGGIEKKEGRFMDFVNESAKKFLVSDRLRSYSVFPGVLGKEAPSVGAALLCRRELFMEVAA